MAVLRKINPYEVFSYIYGEPKSSPVPNLDYEFATARYSNSNFRRAFVDKFIRYVANDSEVEIYNCRFEKPRNEINLINFYIYKKKDKYYLDKLHPNCLGSEVYGRNLVLEIEKAGF